MVCVCVCVGGGGGRSDFPNAISRCEIIDADLLHLPFSLQTLWEFYGANHKVQEIKLNSKLKQVYCHVISAQ